MNDLSYSKTKGAQTGSRLPPLKPYLKITLLYFFFGLLWILFSDHCIERFTSDLETGTLIQTGKGWIFVALSSALIYFASRRAFQEEQTRLREKHAVFRKTIEGAHHILLNYLNQMQMVTLRAEECPGFDRETLLVAQQSTEKAKEELLKLRDIDPTEICADKIDSVIYANLKRKPAQSAKPLSG